MGRGGIRWDTAVATCGNTYYSEETKETCSVLTIVEKFEGVQRKGYSYMNVNKEECLEIRGGSKKETGMKSY